MGGGAKEGHVERDLEEEGVEAGSQGGAGNAAQEGDPQDHFWHDAEKASLWWTFHVTWSHKARKSSLGPEERSR